MTNVADDGIPRLPLATVCDKCEFLTLVCTCVGGQANYMYTILLITCMCVCKQ